VPTLPRAIETVRFLTSSRAVVTASCAVVAMLDAPFSLPDDRLVIASRTRPASILSSPTKRRDLRYLISIGGPSEPPPAGLRNVAMRLRLVFEDETDPARGGPAAHDVERIVAFARSVDFGAGGLLVHCQAGVSRSAAAAVIVLAVRFGPGTERAAVAFVRRSSPDARPNRWMLQLADEALGRCDALVAAWSSAPVSLG
jgi:predicted protein tyrosine phosphatase